LQIDLFAAVSSNVHRFGYGSKFWLTTILFQQHAKEPLHLSHLIDTEFLTDQLLNHNCISDLKPQLANEYVVFQFQFGLFGSGTLGCLRKFSF
jgi:hypothetical protein